MGNSYYPQNPAQYSVGGLCVNTFLLLLTILSCLGIISSTKTYPEGTVQASGTHQLFSPSGRRTVYASYQNSGTFWICVHWEAMAEADFRRKV